MMIILTNETNYTQKNVLMQFKVDNTTLVMYVTVPLSILETCANSTAEIGGFNRIDSYLVSILYDARS